MRNIRIITDVKDDAITYVASTKEGNETITARGATEKSATDNLKAEVQKKAQVKKDREGYPKNVEVEW